MRVLKIAKEMVGNMNAKTGSMNVIYKFLFSGKCINTGEILYGDLYTGLNEQYYIRHIIAFGNSKKAIESIVEPDSIKLLSQDRYRPDKVNPSSSILLREMDKIELYGTILAYSKTAQFYNYNSNRVTITHVSKMLKPKVFRYYETEEGIRMFRIK